jgi:hypothetical protein
MHLPYPRNRRGNSGFGWNPPKGRWKKDQRLIHGSL